MRAVWGRPDYRRLWAARTVSQWGDAFNTVALSLLVLQLTGSALGVSGVVAAEIAPVLLLAPLAGVVVDRYSPVRVMIAADMVRMVLAAVLPLLAGSTAAVYAVTAGISAAAVFFNPAAAALLPRLVDEDELVAANSGIWTAAVLSQIVLAPAAGAVVMAFGFGPAFLVNAASFAVSALLLIGLRAPAAPVGARPVARWWTQARDGARVIIHDRLLRPWPPANCWRRCPPARPAPCSSSSPNSTCAWMPAVTG